MSYIDELKGRKIVIATMHGKEKVIAPILIEELGLEPILVPNLNTDKYGTFTLEIKRSGDQLEAARKKAYEAIRLTGADLSIASEGSFGPHPHLPFINSNLELLLFVDAKNNYEVRGHYSTENTNMDGEYVSSVAEAMEFARRVGFPHHGIIIRNTKDSKYGIIKNIKSEEDLKEVVEKKLKSFLRNKIYIETDMRAHKNPTRMDSIKNAALDLISNIKSVCPRCGTPGYVVNEVEKGLNCSNCNTPTELPRLEIYKCNKCNHIDKKPISIYGTFADPKYCGLCNP